MNKVGTLGGTYGCSRVGSTSYNSPHPTVTEGSLGYTAVNQPQDLAA